MRYLSDFVDFVSTLPADEWVGDSQGEQYAPLTYYYRHCLGWDWARIYSGSESPEGRHVRPSAKSDVLRLEPWENAIQEYFACRRPAGTVKAAEALAFARSLSGPENPFRALFRACL